MRPSFRRIVYFVIFIAVIYFVLVVPYRAYMKKRSLPCSALPRHQDVSGLLVRDSSRGDEMHVLHQRALRGRLTACATPTMRWQVARRPWHNGSVQRRNYFDEEVADRYDEHATEMFEPAVVYAAVSFLAGLAGSGPALELGIGTGRIAVPLSKRAVSVHGIDLSSAMVARLQAKPGSEAISVTIW